VKTCIYVEGAQVGNGPQGERKSKAKAMQFRLEEAVHNLLRRMGFSGRLPRIIAGGGRLRTFDKFKTALSDNNSDYIAMLIDSEDPVADNEQTWAHLKKRDNWDKPAPATDDQVLFMTTCMETWIVADRETLRKHYGSKLHENALPSAHKLEERNRHTVQDNLVSATKDCQNAYQKGTRSFEILAKINPAVLDENLPSFQRIKRILNQKLK
jgi:hypothetical protein